MEKIKKIIYELRKKGVKVTPQRIAIINYLEKNHIHPCIEDIYNDVRKQYPSISLATVYNTMDKLEEINQIVKLKISNEKHVNYEYNLEPHHHFYCKKCKMIYDLDISLDESVIKKSLNHQIDEMHLYIKGICKKCLKDIKN